MCPKTTCLWRRSAQYCRPGIILLFMLHVAAAIVHLPSELTLTAFPVSFYKTPAQLGVEHLQVRMCQKIWCTLLHSQPLTIPSPQLLGDANGRSVLLHVFCRIVRHNDRNVFYGKAFFEASEVLQCWCLCMCVDWFSARWRLFPNIFVFVPRETCMCTA